MSGVAVAAFPNCRQAPVNAQEKSRRRRDFPYSSWFRSELVSGLLAWIALAGITLAGVALTLTARILLLLSGFLTTALLLTGLLAWILILLARILVLARHHNLPC
jgi:hypothetical protein